MKGPATEDSVQHWLHCWRDAPNEALAVGRSVDLEIQLLYSV